MIELRSEDVARTSSVPLLLAALGQRRKLRRERPALVLATAVGGVGSLLDARTSRRLVTILGPAGQPPRRVSVRGWLERRQARRSALVVAPDRATAVAHALRMNLDLARIRIHDDAGSAEVRNHLLREVAGLEARVLPWHSAKR